MFLQQLELTNLTRLTEVLYSCLFNRTNMAEASLKLGVLAVLPMSGSTIISYELFSVAEIDSFL